MDRFEEKFIVSTELYDDLVNDFSQFLVLDSHGLDGNGYIVNSIYYDTPTFKFYRQKIEGNKKKIKVRLRQYNNTGQVFLEIKSKVDKKISKVRRELSGTSTLQCNNLLYNLHNYLKEYNISNIELSNNILNPVVACKYNRLALVDSFPLGGLRITFDKHVTCSSHVYSDNLYVNTHDSLPEGYFILEVKYNNFMPSWVSLILDSYGFSRVSFSKYSNSIDRINELISAPN